MGKVEHQWLEMAGTCKMLLLISLVPQPIVNLLIFFHCLVIILSNLFTECILIHCKYTLRKFAFKKTSLPQSGYSHHVLTSIDFWWDLQNETLSSAEAYKIQGVQAKHNRLKKSMFSLWQMLLKDSFPPLFLTMPVFMRMLQETWEEAPNRKFPCREWRRGTPEEKC